MWLEYFSDRYDVAKHGEGRPWQSCDRILHQLLMIRIVDGASRERAHHMTTQAIKAESLVARTSAVSQGPEADYAEQCEVVPTLLLVGT
jgi:hypothetical protein